MIYVLIAAFLAGLTMGGAGMSAWKEGQIARHEQKQAEAQAQIDTAAKEARQEAQNKIVDMEAAYLAGESNAKTVVQKVYVKGQSYVQSNPTWSTPACTLDDSSLLLANSARSGVRSPADPPIADAGVPATGANPGRENVNPVPATTPGLGAVGPVHPAERPTGSADKVPATSTRPVPKPKPTGRQ